MIRLTWLTLGALVIGVACSSEQQPRTAARDEHASDSAPHEAEQHEDSVTERVTLSEAAYRAAQIHVAAITMDSAAMGEDLQVPGQVEFDPRRVAIISTRITGRVERLLVVEGDRVDSGAVLAELYSTAFLTAQNDLMQARRRLSLLAGTPDEAGARAIVDAARHRLTLLGVDSASLRRIEATIGPEEHLTLKAPFGGTVMAATALTGQAVESGQELFRLADLSVVDVVADVPERALPNVRVGQTATITIAAYPEMQFAGAVERLRGELNPETRTVRAVIHAGNSKGRLRPGMFATVRLAVPAAPGRAELTIPESAVVTDGERRYVFVEVGTRQFERRTVELASLAPPGSAAPAVSRVAVRSGLKVGDRVVTTGAFILKSELAKAGLGEHGH